MINKINLICNKCGTPIIHGENHCRFCGASDYSEKEYIKKYENIEIIDFNEPEVIDFTTGEDDVSIPSGSSEPVAPVAPAMPAAPTPVAAPVSAPAPTAAPADAVAPAPVPEASPITEAPLEATGVLKKIEMPKNDLNDVVTFTSQSKPEEKSIVSESTPYIVTSPGEKEKEQALEEMSKDLTEEQLQNQKEPVDISKTDNKSGHVVGIVILSFFLFISVLANIYFTVANTNVPEDTPKADAISEVTDTTYLGEYKVEAPNNWVKIMKQDYVIFTNSSEEWAASLSIKSNLISNDIESNIDAIREEFGKNKYSFTSTEKINDTETVFKGMYYGYVTQVVTRTLDNDTVAVIDLKFKGEVDEKVYSSVLKTLESVVKADTTSFFKNDFSFPNSSKLVGDVLTK